MRKLQKVCVGNRVGIVKRVLNINVPNNVKVVFVDGGDGWYSEQACTVLNDAQVIAVERRFGRGAWTSVESESKSW